MDISLDLKSLEISAGCPKEGQHFKLNNSEMAQYFYEIFLDIKVRDIFVTTCSWFHVFLKFDMNC